MPVLAIRRVPQYEPEDIGPEQSDEPSYTIGAHADFRREDFVFPRMQSRQMRETPWGARAKPMKSWSELAGMGLLLGMASFVLVLSTVLI
jgi:hypothetical protein